jgi:hypothetical protein
LFFVFVRLIFDRERVQSTPTSPSALHIEPVFIHEGVDPRVWGMSVLLKLLSGSTAVGDTAGVAYMMPISKVARKGGAYYIYTYLLMFIIL